MYTVGKDYLYIVQKKKKKETKKKKESNPLLYRYLQVIGKKGLICTIRGLCKVTKLICSSVYLML